MKLTKYEKEIMFRGWVRFLGESIESGKDGLITKKKIIGRIKTNSLLKHLDQEGTYALMCREGYIEPAPQFDAGPIKYCVLTYKFLDFVYVNCGIRIKKNIIHRMDNLKSRKQRELDQEFIKQKQKEFEESGANKTLNSIRARGRKLVKGKAEEEDHKFNDKIKRNIRVYDNNEIDDTRDYYEHEIETEVIEENKAKEKEDKEDENIVDKQLFTDFLNKF